MNLDTDVVKNLLHVFDFKRLFRELGWDQLAINPVPISVDHEAYACTPVAEKRGAQVYLCTTDVIPGAVLRHKIDNRLTRHAREHLLIFADTAQSRQVWQWAAHTPGQPHFLRSYEWHKGQAGGILTQRLAEIAIPISEEESIDLTLVTHRLKDALDRDRVTKHFYECFAKERYQFQASISGLSDDDAKWYSSVVVNRLMFIYFLQKQGFLDHGDRDYLCKKLDLIQSKGSDRYYWDFLRPLFFEGFARAERTAEVQQLLGDIPYLNGGLFAHHAIEDKYGEKIQIPNAAFEKLLSFFHQYQWTLDDRPLANDNEINPDVLGYIFEKYVNQKQMGAYYTKEDITGYISQETVIPRLFDMVRAKYKPAFEGRGSVFGLLKEDPDAYIYPPMRKGAKDNDGNTISPPANIACGLDDVSRRGDWNGLADPEYALPTEIWREVVTRRQRYEEVRQHLSDGDVADINDLITYNLDIRQFAQDAISQSEDPVFVLRFFEALGSITILDPTCGSGAFLFAALNILERLYEACLQRMEQFQHDGMAYQGQQLRAVEEFNGILKEADKHSNRRYHILKSIVVHNLYGVDIMEEAVEICKLRFFLRLVAELKPGQPVEPLPDIDFNIKAGNTLVGYVHLKDAVAATEKQLFGKEAGVRIQQKAEDLARLYRKMQEQQMTIGGRVTVEDKRALQQRRDQLVNELDEYLAYDYAVQTTSPKALQEWRFKTQPFHWFAEFYDIINAGGFGAVIGNPPYVEYAKVRGLYTVKGYATEACGNLYAFVLERSAILAAKLARMGMIVQLPIVCTDRMKPAQTLLQGARGYTWYATFDDRPGRLFDGLEHIRATILLTAAQDVGHRTFATKYNRWYSEFRPALFPTLAFLEQDEHLSYDGAIAKLGDPIAHHILQRILACPRLAQHSGKPSSLMYHNAPQYWIRAFGFEPYFWNERQGQALSTQVKRFEVRTDPSLALALMNSSLFYWWFVLLSDCRHLNAREIEHFPVPTSADGLRLRGLTTELMRSYKEHTVRKTCNYKATGKVVYDEFYPRYSKNILDQIDRELAGAYGLTDEELDYVINYDIKYRMGADNEDEGDQ